MASSLEQNSTVKLFPHKWTKTAAMFIGTPNKADSPVNGLLELDFLAARVHILQ